MSHSNLIIFVITPLMLSIGITAVLPFSEADAEFSQICIDKVWLETTKGRIACVTPSTAERLVERGWGTLLDEADLKESTEKIMPYTPGMEIDYTAELLLVPQVDGGKRALTVTPIIGTPDREFSKTYVAGTEELAEDEMRITFCVTGMPYPVYQQASACVIVELGNGEVFLFDLGADSVGRINGMQIDTDKLNKIFLGHLHLDHAGDLAARK